MKGRNIIRLGFYLFAVIIVLISFSLIAFIPSAVGPKLSVGSDNTNEHLFQRSKYRVDFEKGKTYTIKAVMDSFWGLDIEIKVYCSTFLLSAKKVDSVSTTEEQIEITASRTGTHHVVLTSSSGSGFFDLSINEEALGSSGTVENHFNAGWLVLLITPFILFILATVVFEIITRSVAKSAEEKKGIFGLFQSEQRQAKSQVMSTASPQPVTSSYEDERKKDLQKIFRRYKRISLDEMAKLLNFRNRIELQDWLMDLPTTVEFTIDSNYLIIPENLQKDSPEAKDTIATMAQSLTKLHQDTCAYCGEPVAADEDHCTGCGKKLLKCVVCKLPVSFGEEQGHCSLCGAKGHLSHLQEWAKVKGECPQCMQKIPIEGIVPIEIEGKKK